MQTNEEFEEVMEHLQRQALERKLAEPAVSFALHAIDCHHTMLAALKDALNETHYWRDRVMEAIAKAERTP